MKIRTLGASQNPQFTSSSFYVSFLSQRFAHCDWFILPLVLPTPTIWFSLDHKQNVSDDVVSEIRRNGNVLTLLTPIPKRL